QLLRLILDDPEVLLDEVDVEAGVEVALRDARAELLERPGAARAGRERLDDERLIDAAQPREVERLDDAHHVHRAEDLVARLHGLARALGAAVGDPLAHDVEDLARAL